MRKLMSAVLILSLFLSSCPPGFGYAEENPENLQLPPVLTEEASLEMTPHSLNELDSQYYDAEKDFRFTLGEDVVLFKNVFEPQASDLLPERRGSSKIIFIDRNQLSHLLREVGRMVIYVKGRGEKVNKIEILQNDRLLVRTYNVESFSSAGRYHLIRFQILQPFLYPDGENEVLVKFYNNETLIASHPYTLTSVAHAKVSMLFVNIKQDRGYANISDQHERYMGLDAKKAFVEVQVLGIKESDLIEIDLVDSAGTKVAEPFLSKDNKYLDWNGSIRKKVGFTLYTGRLREGMILIPQVKVNGEIIMDNETSMKVVASPEIISNPRYEKLPDSLKLGIVNGDRLRNAVIEFWQQGRLVGSTTDYSIKWDEENLVYYMDIPMRNAYFNHPGGEFILKVRDSNRLLFKQLVLPSRDASALNPDNWLTEDGLSPNAKVVPLLINQPTDKIFRVRFSDPIDVSSITNTNAYVIDKESGKRLELDPSKLKLESVEDKPVTEYEMTAAVRDEYRPGQLYILVLEPGIRSLNGKELKKQTVLYFTIR